MQGSVLRKSYVIMMMAGLLACEPQVEKPPRRKQVTQPGQDSNKKPTTDPVDNTGPVSKSPEDPTDQAPSAESLIKADTLKAHLTQLAGSTYKGRGSGTAEHEAAAEYVATEFKKYGLVPVKDNYFQAFKLQNSGATTYNVVGMLPGTDPTLKDETVIIGAHLDHLGTKSGKIYFGADDNASGSSALINVAQALSAMKSSLKRTVLFIAFSGEELGLLGSRHYVSAPLRPLNKTVFMINMDMVGYSKGKLSAMGISSGSLADQFISSIKPKYSQLEITITSDHVDGRSDHAPFMQSGIPITLFHTGVHSNYHQPSDTPEKIDFASLELIGKICLELAVHVINNASSGFEARAYASYSASPFSEIDDYFTAYFNEHGLGRPPEPGHILDSNLPGQPL